jgi:two-component system cell cycle response regulator DivK
VTTVLVIEDDDRNRKLAREVLAAAGFRTLDAATGAEGIMLARTEVPDVILVDLRLPDIGGAEVAHLLHADPRTAGIPAVAMSALPLEGNEDWVAAAGFAGAIEKPISVQRFPDEVSSYCADPEQ